MKVNDVMINIVRYADDMVVPKNSLEGLLQLTESLGL